MRNKKLSKSLSPYNPAHGDYGDCCGIFNDLNDDGILICNECGMTINELLDNFIGNKAQLCECTEPPPINVNDTIIRICGKCKKIIGE